ncbi:transmembrane protease serine 9-like [Bacillus rossius redtenbacheri]|uniref:transmembrane protease serine 9-like n=1 Tax=Bacillus rossius redtenbacheri TaxID=93214 RepID=UPI002FDEF061
MLTRWLTFSACVLAAVPGEEAQLQVKEGDRAGTSGHPRVFFDEFFGLVETSDDDEKDETRRNCTCPQCGVVNQEIRIVGGRPTGVNRYPWVARLVYDGQFHCGGSLLDSRYVLTAAHCVRRLKKSKIRVYLGDHDQFNATETPVILRMVSAVIRHRNFDVNSYNHDIALLRLRKPITYTKRVRPVCLPQDDADPAGRSGIVVGWGRTTEGGALPSIVQEVQVPILTLQQCRQSKYKPSRITPNMLCAGRGDHDSCQGDSGGPLVIQSAPDRLEIVGIVSWGVGCGRPGYPGVYTRVTRYRDWIRRNMRDSCQCSKSGSRARRGRRTNEARRAGKSEAAPRGNTSVPAMRASRRGPCVLAAAALLSWAAATGSQNASENGASKGIFGNFFVKTTSPAPPLNRCTCSCGLPNEETRIVGGVTTRQHEYPWMVRLTYFNRFYCGAMLINDRYIMTAAHCVRGFIWFMIKATFGEHDRCDAAAKPESRFVIRAFTGDFSFSLFSNDIAVLRLSARVPVSAHIRPVCLPRSAEPSYEGASALAAGWGTLGEGGKVACSLQKVDLPVMGNQQCRLESAYNQRMITDKMLCAGHLVGGKDSCQGDSGGPLVTLREDKKYEVIGIVSWGNGCARKGYPGIYTRVNKYLDWILEHSRDGCFCDDD